MFFKGSIGGLSPGARYGVTVSVEIATDTPGGCVGAGGPPGESVWIKAGATAVEPLAVRDGSYLRMNVDIGSQSAGGAQAVVLGNVANSRSCEQSLQWERKSLQGRSTPMPTSIPSDGRAWLLFGADSGFAGRTEVYFIRAAVTSRRCDASPPRTGANRLRPAPRRQWATLGRRVQRPNSSWTIDGRQEREATKVGVARADPVDAVLAHQHSRVHAVHPVAAQVGRFRQGPPLQRS